MLGNCFDYCYNYSNGGLNSIFVMKPWFEYGNYLLTIYKDTIINFLFRSRKKSKKFHYREGFFFPLRRSKGEIQNTIYVYINGQFVYKLYIPDNKNNERLNFLYHRHDLEQI
uniref:Uncharacterized protein n=2 Tax=Cacopsylla melanoneura TaxID=428564 RepID=A0A8D9FE52_9HEMI